MASGISWIDTGVVPRVSPSACTVGDTTYCSFRAHLAALPTGTGPFMLAKLYEREAARFLEATAQGVAGRPITP